jgi:hypothetical protein
MTAHDRPSKSQLRKLTATLEEHEPPRADIELLHNGNLLVALYRTRTGHIPKLLPCHYMLFNRRGSLIREAVRGESGAWDHFLADKGSLDSFAGMPRSTPAVVRFMRGHIARV